MSHRRPTLNLMGRGERLGERRLSQPGRRSSCRSRLAGMASLRNPLPFRLLVAASQPTPDHRRYREREPTRDDAVEHGAAGGRPLLLEHDREGRDSITGLNASRDGETAPSSPQAPELGSHQERQGAGGLCVQRRRSRRVHRDLEQFRLVAEEWFDARADEGFEFAVASTRTFAREEDDDNSSHSLMSTRSRPSSTTIRTRCCSRSAGRGRSANRALCNESRRSNARGVPLLGSASQVI